MAATERARADADPKPPRPMMPSVILLLLVLGCGGRATTDPIGPAPGGVSGSMMATSPSPAGAGAGGTLLVPVPDLPVTVPDLPPPPLERCDLPAPSCHAKGTYVQIDDEPATQLTVPYASNCASCWIQCEDCSANCELSATGVSGCGVFSLRLSACAGADQTPPCLDTAGEQPHYVDVGGKSWSVVAFQGRAVTEPGPTTLDADLTLALQDGTTTRELSAHVFVCAAVNATLIPCK